MKTTRRSIISLLVLAVFTVMSFTITGCSEGGKKDSKIEKTKDQSGPEYTSAYVCPMHCKGSGSDEPGKCNICGMDYIENKDHAKHKESAEGDDHEGHDEADDHEGHDHD